ncbi:MAG: AAA family ATPase, partial [Acetobacteraceae bacterium]|nr:AAA family ATPase [Acetobacteraceae bacterium]
EIELKGIAGPVSAWQALRPSAVASRFEALRGLTLSPLVGRDEEIDLLLRRWARAKAGDGQAVLVSGEPGIGKSRITAELEGRLHTEPHIRLRYFCSPYCRDSALYPFIDQLWHAAEFAPDDPPEVKLEKLEGVLARSASPDEDVAFLADLMSLPAPERFPLPNLSPQRKKEKTLEGADPAARRSGAPAAGADGLRGRALDRSNLARIARPHHRARPQPADSADRDVPPRVSAAMDRPAAGDDAHSQSPGPPRSGRSGGADRRRRGVAR